MSSNNVWCTESSINDVTALVGVGNYFETTGEGIKNCSKLRGVIYGRGLTHNFEFELIAVFVNKKTMRYWKSEFFELIKNEM